MKDFKNIRWKISIVSVDSGQETKVEIKFYKYFK